MSESMSESKSTKAKAASIRALAADAHALAEVEKWMAMIREINGNPRQNIPPSDTALASADADGWA